MLSACAAVLSSGSTIAAPVAAQDTAAPCASAFWLEPLAAAGEEAPAPPAAAPAWLTAELTDACSGETFALADFLGKTVYIESMATWCVNCHGQLTRATEAAGQIAEDQRDDVVFVALSSEVDLPHEALAQYAADNAFPFIFAVMPAEFLQAMAGDLGQEIAVPPAMPLIIVAPDGTVGELHTGGASVEDVLALVTEGSGSS
jgi:thiol-disulfide isomerase/thioredoxin